MSETAQAKPANLFHELPHLDQPQKSGSVPEFALKVFSETANQLFFFSLSFWFAN